MRRSHQPHPSEPRLTAEQLEAWSTFTAPQWQPFKDAWLRRGFRWPPIGSPDSDDTSQRGLLWQIADARPDDLGLWVGQAKGISPRDVIAFVLDRWHGAREAAGIEDAEWSATKERERHDRQPMTRLNEILAGKS